MFSYIVKSAINKINKHKHKTRIDLFQYRCQSPRNVIHLCIYVNYKMHAYVNIQILQTRLVCCWQNTYSDVCMSINKNKCTVQHKYIFYQYLY